MRALSARFQATRELVIGIQRYSRGYLARQRYNKRLSAVITIQAGARKMIAMRQYRQMRREVRVTSFRFSCYFSIPSQIFP